MTDSEHDITAAERDVVLRLLEPRGEHAAAFRAQLAGARVRSSCECGCPSFLILVPVTGPRSTAPRSESTNGPLTDGYAETTDGHAIGLILWQSAGLLCAVEIYAYEDIGPFALSDLVSISASDRSDGPPTASP